ncbi:MAG: chondroitinase-B domain-containing protein, partial [Acidobacteriota bacterium]|nr:chondroitinase-B domain-containing protein [Acidobacteriota bacterium]
MIKNLVAAGLTTWILLPSAWAADATTPGEVSTPYPTLINLSVEWAITGDDDLDGVVAVEYRRSGSGAWLDAMPLRRIPAGSNVGFSWGNKHSGSILDLDPDTQYEIRLTLSDPDGGSETRTVSARTRAVPADPPNPRVRSANPSSLSSVMSSAEPGDIIVLESGGYAGFNVGRSGTASEPIVMRSETPGGAVFNGDFRIDNRSYVHLEDVTVNGMIKFNNSTGIVVRRCSVNTGQHGIVAIGNGATNAYIADNVVIGSTGWDPSTVGTSGNNTGEGIQITGPGNVIAYNRVRGFRDAISFMEDSGARNQVSIDVYNNDIEVGADDGIEADFCMGNCRIMRNRITNANVALSSQPGLGGPTYFIRNVVYNLTLVAFKLHRGSVGDVALHNTSIKCGDAHAVYTSDTFSDAWFRNNIFIGGAAGSSECRGTGAVAVLYAAGPTCHFDYDGYGSIGTGEFRGNIIG